MVASGVGGGTAADTVGEEEGGAREGAGDGGAPRFAALLAVSQGEALVDRDVHAREGDEERREGDGIADGVGGGRAANAALTRAGEECEEVEPTLQRAAHHTRADHRRLQTLQRALHVRRDVVERHCPVRLVPHAAREEHALPCRAAPARPRKRIRVVHRFSRRLTRPGRAPAGLPRHRRKHRIFG